MLKCGHTFNKCVLRTPFLGGWRCCISHALERSCRYYGSCCPPSYKYNGWTYFWRPSLCYVFLSTVPSYYTSASPTLSRIIAWGYQSTRRIKSAGNTYRTTKISTDDVLVEFQRISAAKVSLNVTFGMCNALAAAWAPCADAQLHVPATGLGTPRFRCCGAQIIRIIYRFVLWRSNKLIAQHRQNNYSLDMQRNLQLTRLLHAQNLY